MRDEEKSKEQLIGELVEIRKELSKLKKPDEEKEIECKNMIVAATGYEADYDYDYDYTKSNMNLNKRLVENSLDITIVIDKDGYIKDIFPSIEKKFGFKNESAIGVNIFDYIHTDDISEVANAINSMLKFPNIPKYIQVRTSEISIGMRYFEAIGTNMLEDKDIGGIVFNSRDITEKKITEKQLVDEKEKLIATLKNIGEAVITVDCNEKILLMNSAAEIFTGWKTKNALSKPLKEVICLRNRKTKEVYEDPLSKMLKEGENFGICNGIVMVSRFGRERIVCGSGTTIVGEDGKVNGTVVVIKDITEKVKLDEELSKAARIETIGVLAGGIAHDFNNILTIILGNISLAKMKAFKEPREKVYERLVEIEKATLNAKGLTQQLLTFSKGGEPIIKTVSISRLLKEAAVFALRGSDIKCNFNIPKDLWTAEIDEGQINQVINNLIINAKQAMIGGGVITIGAENVVIDENSDIINLNNLKPGRYIKIWIKDKGIGISEEDLNKIFDPYFTTKSCGNGFVLTTSYSIIKKHGGYITVKSALEKGTTFFIYLPASTKAGVNTVDTNQNVIHASGRILIVDDNCDVSAVAGNMLKEIGYEVQFAKNGFEAIEIYKKGKFTGNGFEAVIMDLTIPGSMGGKEIIRWLHDIDPNVKAIVSSGYSNDPVMANYSEYGFKGVVAKPYKIHEIGETLYNVISGN